MLAHPSRSNLRTPWSSTWICRSCQLKAVANRRTIAAKAKGREPLPMPKWQIYRKNMQPPTLEPLRRPVGQPEPPKPGDNAARDLRPLRERIDDYFNSHEAARTWSRPYFIDWHRTRFYKGKHFLASPKLFRADLSLYFPNLQGQTLERPEDKYQDIIRTLRGKASVVSVVSEQWAELQCNSYTNPAENPALGAELERLKTKGLQRVFLNIEESRIKAWLVRRSFKHWRSITPKEEWSRTFLITKGISDYFRHDLMIKNHRVGYVFLVDKDCKIRWAGCGDATDSERESLVEAAVRLVEPPPVTADGKALPRAKAPLALANMEHAAKTPSAKLQEWQKMWDAVKREGRKGLTDGRKAS